MNEQQGNNNSTKTNSLKKTTLNISHYTREAVCFKQTRQ